MRTAEPIRGIIHARGKPGWPLAEGYRPLDPPQLYLHADGRSSQTAGAMPPGSPAEPVEGMALATIAALIDALRQDRYRGPPVRRVYSEKHHSNQNRPRGLPPWSDKLRQAVLRLMLAASAEPQFSHYAHGFRPKRGGPTA
jgi:hypothetical protein